MNDRKKALYAEQIEEEITELNEPGTPEEPVEATSGDPYDGRDGQPAEGSSDAPELLDAVDPLRDRDAEQIDSAAAEPGGQAEEWE